MAEADACGVQLADKSDEEEDSTGSAGKAISAPEAIQPLDTADIHEVPSLQHKQLLADMPVQVVRTCKHALNSSQQHIVLQRHVNNGSLPNPRSHSSKHKGPGVPSLIVIKIVISMMKPLLDM